MTAPWLRLFVNGKRREPDDIAYKGLFEQVMAVSPWNFKAGGMVEIGGVSTFVRRTYWNSETNELRVDTEGEP